jgi:hypothetical protein
MTAINNYSSDQTDEPRGYLVRIMSLFQHRSSCYTLPYSSDADAMPMFFLNPNGHLVRNPTAEKDTTSPVKSTHAYMPLQKYQTPWEGNGLDHQYQSLRKRANASSSSSSSSLEMNSQAIPTVDMPYIYIYIYIYIYKYHAHRQAHMLDRNLSLGQFLPS